MSDSTPTTSSVEEIAQLKFTATRIYEEQDTIIRVETGTSSSTAVPDIELSDLPALADPSAVVSARHRLLAEIPSSIPERKALAQEAMKIMMALSTTVIPLLTLTDEEFVRKRCLVLR
ncbi:hypothetical protein DXG03_003529 [Asterophora parasitica]|uniref:Uncharacterized protein n=1 Tax=Asterophora parasitica TaxID=117018 RepID=A0A9P7G4X6_9AGAR|nr:hypothetical protein DXG03_003529 [Asterophora parasitica]